MVRLTVLVAALMLALLAGRDAAGAYWRPAYPAQDSLRRSPLDAAAMRQLAIAADIAQAGAGQAKFALAERISRRDLPSELQMIQTAVRQNDIASALHHYDHVLSVHPASRKELFPILASALAELELRKALAGYAARPWLREFVSRAVDQDAAPAPLMAFYGDLAGKVPEAELQASLIRTVDWFATNHQTAELGTMVARMPGVAPGTFDALGFTPATTAPRFQSMAWQLQNDEVITAEASGNALSVEIAPEKTGIAASRRTFFKPGEYVMTQSVSYVADSPRARLAWRVSCLGEGQIELPLATSFAQAARLTVPPGCGAQVWQLQASAAISQVPSRARISDLALRRQ